MLSTGIRVWFFVALFHPGVISLCDEVKLAFFSILSHVAILLFSIFFSFFWFLTTAEDIERKTDLALECQCRLEGLLVSSTRWGWSSLRVLFVPFSLWGFSPGLWLACVFACTLLGVGFYSAFCSIPLHYSLKQCFFAWLRSCNWLLSNWMGWLSFWQFQVYVTFFGSLGPYVFGTNFARCGG